MLQQSSSTRKIVDWLEAQRYEVVPGVSYTCCWDTRTITYRPQDSVSTIVNGLLHECGHILVDRSIRRGGTRYKRGYPFPRAGKARPNISAVDLVHEEIEAWHRGLALAQRLGIRVNLRAYWQDYGKCVKSYFRKAIRRVL